MNHLKIQANRTRWIKFFIHLIVISIIFLLPEWMMNYGRPRRFPNQGLLIYLRSAVYVVVFYIEYYFIIGKVFIGNKRHKVLKFVGLNLLLIVVVLGLLYWVQSLLLPEWPPKRFKPHQPITHKVELMRQGAMVLRDVGIMLLTIALGVAMRFADVWNDFENRHQKLLASQRADELQNLKSQLNPHFLFNTLNTIYALIEVSPREAQQAVHTLSKLLRYVLYENPATVSLEQEVEFAQNYIALMQMRLGKGVIRADFSGIVDKKANIAPLLFVSLIENAFKHGNTGKSGHTIDIEITSTPDGVVTCHTFNHYNPESDKSGKSTDRRGGIGLANLQRRLHLIYGDDATLVTTKGNDDMGCTYSATLTIKVNPTKQ